MSYVRALHRCFIRRKVEHGMTKFCVSQTSRWYCRRLFSFSASNYQDPTLRWAQSNPQMAQLCINPSPQYELTGMDSTSSHEKVTSLEGYLKWRRWTIPHNAVMFQEEAVALASHVLSTPLTLASNIHELQNHRTDDSLNRWCCIGARAEATLPSMYWKEFLLLGSALELDRHHDENIDSKFLGSILEVNLDFIGPDIPSKTLKQHISISCNRRDDNSHNILSSTISLQTQHRGLFHEMSDMALTSWDAYILFNPGIGHQNLKNDWNETLRLVLEHNTQSTRVVLLTAHSERDAARDTEVLSNYFGLSNVQYSANPFASRITYMDPFDVDYHLVQPNQFVSVVRI